MSTSALLIQTSKSMFRFLRIPELELEAISTPPERDPIPSPEPPPEEPDPEPFPSPVPAPEPAPAPVRNPTIHPDSIPILKGELISMTD